MGETSIAQSNALTKIAYEQKLFRDMQKDTFFMKFHGKTPSDLVYVKRDPDGEGNSKKATRVTFGLSNRLTGDAFKSNETLEGNEMDLDLGSFTLSLEEYAGAVKDAGTLDRMRPAFSLDEESRDAIRVWGEELLDQLHFDAIQSSPTRVITPVTNTPYTSTPLASAKSALTSTAKITPEFLSRFKTYAMTGGNRNIIPLRPIKIPGIAEKVYVFLTHPDALHDFKRDSEVQENLRVARERSKNHPLFMGATAYTSDGVIVYAHENMNIGTDAGSGSDVPYAQSVFMGAQALCWAWGKRPKLVPKQYDFDRKHAFGWLMVCRTAKPVFSSEDYGSIGSVVARTQISDA